MHAFGSCGGLTQPPSAHVVELRAEQEGRQYVDDRENDPEDGVSSPKDLDRQRAAFGVCVKVCVWVFACAYHSDHGEEDDGGQTGVGGVSTGVDVRMPLLIQLQHTESSDHVHEGRVCKMEGETFSTRRSKPTFCF